MGYIDRNLLPNEQIIFRTRKHLIIFFVPILFFIISIFATYYMQKDPLLSKVIWIPWLVTALYWAYMLVEYLASEYAVTDKRIMMREGFFTRHANEMRLNTISQVNIEQSLIGQVLNYGTIALNAFGAFDRFDTVASPFEFQKSVNEQLDKIVSSPPQSR